MKKGEANAVGPSARWDLKSGTVPGRARGWRARSFRWGAKARAPATRSQSRGRGPSVCELHARRGHDEGGGTAELERISSTKERALPRVEARAPPRPPAGRRRDCDALGGVMANGIEPRVAPERTPPRL